MKKVTEDRELLSTKEIYRIYGLSRYALIIWERQGLLHPIRTPGGQRRYVKDEIDELLQLKQWKQRVKQNAKTS